MSEIRATYSDKKTVINKHFNVVLLVHEGYAKYFYLKYNLFFDAFKLLKSTNGMINIINYGKV